MNFVLIVISLIIFVCVLLNKVSNKFGLPVLLAFLMLGIISAEIGSHTTRGFHSVVDVEKVCTIALIFIMFYGGFSTRLESAKPVLFPAAMLATVGVVITAGLTGLFCHWALGWEWDESFLMGAVISSTDAASVFSILRSRKLGLKNNTAPMLEVESGSNDPMSYMLTMMMLAVFEGNASGGMVVKLILMQISIGAACGFAIAYSLIILFRHNIKLGSTGFDSVMVFSVALISFAIPAFLGGNGYLSAYICGILLGNSQEFTGKKTVMSFFDGVTSMTQILIFYVLGSTTRIASLHGVAISAIIIFLFITLVSRPIAVSSVLFCWKDKFPFKQNLLVSFVGLRGAASIVFATMILSAGVQTHHDIFNIVFYIVLISILIQGSLIPYVSKKLDMIDANENVLKTFNDFSEESEMSFGSIEIDEDSPWKDRMVRDLKLPKNLLLVLLLRDGDRIVPKGHTTLLEGDLVITCAKAYIGEMVENIYQHKITRHSPWAGHTIKEYPYKTNRVIVLINRGEERIIPNGNTILQVGDLLTIFDRDEEESKKLLEL